MVVRLACFLGVWIGVSCCVSQAIADDITLANLRSSYAKAREKSLFGDEFKLTSVETKSFYNGRSTKQEVSYVQKLPCRKAILTILDSNERNNIGYSVVGVLDKSNLVMSHRFPKDVDYFLDSVITDQDDAIETFRSVLPIFRPHCIDDNEILEILNKESFDIQSIEMIQENEREFIQFKWSYRFDDPGGPAIKSGTMKLDKNNLYSLVEADYVVGLVDKPPVREHMVRIEYLDIANKRLPSKLTVKHTIPNSKKWTQIEFDNIVFDFSPVVDSEFDVSKYGFKQDSKLQRFTVYILLFVLVFFGYLMARRYSRTPAK